MDMHSSMYRLRYRSQTVRQPQRRDWMDKPWLLVEYTNGLPTCKDTLKEGTAPPEDTQEAKLEEILSEGTARPNETGCQAQLEQTLSEGTAPPEDPLCRTQLGIATNETDRGETVRSGDDHEDPAIATSGIDETGQGERDKEQIPPRQETDMPQPMHVTPQHDTRGEHFTTNAEETLSEGTAPPEDPLCRTQLGVTTNETDHGGETGTERSGDVHEEHVLPPCHKLDLLQAEPYMTSQQVSQSASDPAVTTNETDRSGETETVRSGDDHEDPAVATSGIDETGQGERDKEQILPSQETDMLQPMHVSPQHDTRGEHFTANAACSNVTGIRPHADPERAKAVAAKDTLQSHSYTLSKCINPSALASGLYSQKIINSEDYELASYKVYGTERERALILLVKVIQQLERKPKWFHTVCDILKKEGVSIKKLKCDYQCKYDELTQDSAGQTGAIPSKVPSSDSESGSEVDSNSPTVESQGAAFLQPACGSGSSMTNSGVKENIPTENDGTLLHRALDHGYCSLFNILRSHLTDTDVNAQDKKGRTPLHVACSAINEESPVQRQMHKVVIPYLLESGARADIMDEDEQTPLHLACQKSDAHTAEMLLRHNTSCLRLRNKNKDTPLHIACCEGALDVVDVLLKYKADPHVQNKDGNTPLHLACLNDKVARRLVSYDGSTTDALDQNQNTPLHLACQKPITGATLVIILQNKRIDKYNSEGFTTLHLASSCGNYAVVKQLLKHCRTDSFVNCQNKDGNTALHLACQNGFEKVVSLLLKSKYKTKRERRNFANKTPIDVARENGHMSVVQCLDPRKNFFSRHKFIRKTY